MLTPLLVNARLNDYITVTTMPTSCASLSAPVTRGLVRRRARLFRHLFDLLLELKMTVFDYAAAAELFPSRRKFRTTRAAYMRFATAAEAIRYAVEVLPERSFLGTILEVDEQRFDSEKMRRLYDAAEYPLARQPAAVADDPVQKAS